MDKKELRRQIREKKRAMSEEQIVAASLRLGEMLFSTKQYQEAKTLYGYLPYNQEVRTVSMLQRALADGLDLRAGELDARLVFIFHEVLVIDLLVFTSDFYAGHLLTSLCVLEL